MPQLPGELFDVICTAAMPLPPSMQSEFAEQVVARLLALPADTLGVGLAHRIAFEEQRIFLRQRGVTVATGRKIRTSA
jgi:hypothetical protein